MGHALNDAERATGTDASRQREARRREEGAVLPFFALPRAVPSRPENDYIEGTTLERLDIGGGTFWKSADETYEAPGGLFNVERFGDGSDGLHFTLRSYSYLYDAAVVYIDLESLGAPGTGLTPVEMIEGRSLVWDERDGMMRVVVPVKYSETLVISLVEQ